MAEEEPPLSPGGVSDSPDEQPPLWHEDGDIMLAVSQDNKTYRFRVHRFILSLHSPVFKDMLQIGRENPSAEDKLFDCPSVTLYDAVDDLRVFLKALYKGLALFNDRDGLTFDRALGLLRLSHKYQIYDLRSGIAQLLKGSWPLNRNEYITLNPAQHSDRGRILKCIKLINAARLSDVPELLPTAFYELACSDIDAWSPNSLTEFLSAEDSFRLMAGRRRMIRRMTTLCHVDMPRWNNPPATLWNRDSRIKAHICTLIKEPCWGGSGCHQVYMTFAGQQWSICRGVLRNCYIRLSSHLLRGDPLLLGLNPLLDHDNSFPEEKVCSGCSKWMEALILNKEEEIWHNVPVDFDLPPITPEAYLTKQALHMTFS